MKKVLLFLVLAIVYSLKLNGQTIQETVIKEVGGFEWIITESFNGMKFKRGAKSTQGKELIPCEYDVIYYHNHYFYAVKENDESNKKALYSDAGSCIIPITKQANDLMVITPEVGSPFVLVQKGSKYGTCSLSGEEIIKIEYDNLFAHEGQFYTKNSNGEMEQIVNEEKPTKEENFEDDFIGFLQLWSGLLDFSTSQTENIPNRESDKDQDNDFSKKWLMATGDTHFENEEYKKAVECYEKAATKGYDCAQVALGYCYVRGLGVVKDAKEGVKWYRKAAEQGNKTAQRNLGICYILGNGTTKDYNEAEKWLRKAADQGDEEAKEILKEKNWELYDNSIF